MWETKFRGWLGFTNCKESMYMQFNDQTTILWIVCSLARLTCLAWIYTYKKFMKPCMQPCLAYKWLGSWWKYKDLEIEKIMDHKVSICNSYKIWTYFKVTFLFMTRLGNKVHEQGALPLTGIEKISRTFWNVILDTNEYWSEEIAFFFQRKKNIH